MGDWKLTDFNTRLAENAYRNSFDHPKGKRAAAPLVAPPPMPPAPLPATMVNSPSLPQGTETGWYTGPWRLAPESVGNLEHYFREAPGARLERILKPIVHLLAVFGLVFLLLLAALLVKFHPPSTAATPLSTDAHRGKIGILNPEWVRQKSYLRSDREWPAGHFSTQANDFNAVALPDKFIYVAPETAQADLKELIGMGLVTIAGGPPNAAKDFAQLKKLGITTD